MSHVWKDRVYETSTTTGTGDITVAGALTGARTFASVCAVNDTALILIEAVDGSGNPTGQWEIDLATYSATNTLTRTTLIDSSTGSAIDFAAGTKRVSMVNPAYQRPGLVRISEIVTTSSQSNVSFTSIPPIYRDLMVRVRGRGTKTATSVDIRMRFNGDSGGNYDYDVTQLVNTSTVPFTGVAQTSLYTGNVAAASATSGIADMIEVTIGDYRGTTFQKAAMYRSTLKTTTAASGFYAERGSLWWRSTSAINQVDIFPSSNGFVDGTVVSLYGLA